MKLRVHLQDISSTCEETEHVTEHLKKVRDLLKSLQECPGRDDFRLRVPGDAGIPNFGSVTIFKAKLPKEKRCSGLLIEEACKARGMRPLCDHTNYRAGARINKCWSAPLKPKDFGRKHFSHPVHNRQLGIDVNALTGMCFMANQDSRVLYNTGSTHAWTTPHKGAAIHRPDGKPGPEGKTTWYQEDQDKEGWTTACAYVPTHKKPKGGILIDGLPAYKVSVGTGPCLGRKIVEACAAKGMTPLCARGCYDKAYGPKKEHLCWSPKNLPFMNTYFTLPHSAKKDLGVEPEELAGYCFFAGDGAKNTPRAGASLYNPGKARSTHYWSNNYQQIRDGKETWNARDADKTRGWNTLCVKEGKVPEMFWKSDQ